MRDGSSIIGRQTVVGSASCLIRNGPRLCRREASRRDREVPPGRSARLRPRAAAKDRFAKGVHLSKTLSQFHDRAAVEVVVGASSCRSPEHDAETRCVFSHGQRDRADQRLLSQDRSGPFPQRASRAETPVSGNAFPLLHPGTVGSRAWGEPWLKIRKDIPLDGCAARSVDHAFELENAANYLHRVLKHQPGSA